jgi:hypothetical protein
LARPSPSGRSLRLCDCRRRGWVIILLLTTLRALPLLSKYAFGLIAVHVVLIPLGILAEWPAQFDPSSDPDAGAEWASRGTAVSAPLVPLLGLAIGGWLVWRGKRWGIAGAILLLIVGALMLIGSLGEAFAEAEQTPRTVLVITGIVGTTLALTLMALATGDLVARLKARRSAPQ